MGVEQNDECEEPRPILVKPSTEGKVIKIVDGKSSTVDSKKVIPAPTNVCSRTNLNTATKENKEGATNRSTMMNSRKNWYDWFSGYFVFFNFLFPVFWIEISTLKMIIKFESTCFYLLWFLQCLLTIVISKLSLLFFLPLALTNFTSSSIHFIHSSLAQYRALYKFLLPKG